MDDLPQMADSNRFGQIFGRTRKSRLIRIPKDRRSDIVEAPLEAVTV